MTYYLDLPPYLKFSSSLQVDIRFPQSGATDPNCVTVTGLPDNVEEAIDHILNLEEEYLADVVDNEAMQVYMKPPAHEEAKAASKGFVVRDAPWTAGNTEKAPDMSSSEDFPSFGAQVAPKTLPWGPKR
ncbi:Vigilin [Varanus komodoensis]|nr:Vigilin [Varanus komodoensis]